ncbi:hypothetical protein BJ508DRAFT_315470 [Ascobolus immersus RN42]|uniref:F-box domain-containing protein n=1 Tax=Ascobolus immersus RN42 TaxID=1160509 RepID=A0A3N4HAN4_ASCIM|nr:hypothetical protein BJ508DRAFT_315470 [Ascobolus immersus RN42]
MNLTQHFRLHHAIPASESMMPSSLLGLAQSKHGNQLRTRKLRSRTVKYSTGSVTKNRAATFKKRASKLQVRNARYNGPSPPIPEHGQDAEGVSKCSRIRPRDPSARPIVDIPTNILSRIFSHLHTAQAYLSMHLVCRRFHTVASSTVTRRLFAHTWFSTNCNDSRNKAPSLVQYLARYIRLHCIKGNGDEYCTTQHPLLDESKMNPRRFMLLIRNEKEVSWRFHAFGEFTVPCFYTGSGERYARTMMQIEKDMEDATVPEGGWLMDNIGDVLQVPDVVFAEGVIRTFNEIETHGIKEGYEPTCRRDLFSNNQSPYGHPYLWRMQLMRDTYVCNCVASNPSTMREREEWIEAEEVLNGSAERTRKRMSSYTAPLRFWPPGY